MGAETMRWVPGTAIAERAVWRAPLSGARRFTSLVVRKIWWYAP
jgi:hypothetical protein